MNSFVIVKKDYVVRVEKSFLDIHLFWAGKGACCILTQAYYGPVISAYVSFCGAVKRVHVSLHVYVKVH